MDHDRERLPLRGPYRDGRLAPIQPGHLLAKGNQTESFESHHAEGYQPACAGFLWAALVGDVEGCPGHPAESCVPGVGGEPPDRFLTGLSAEE